MKKIDLEGLEITCFTEQLENGLEVVLIPYENKKNYFMSYATRFGSDILEFTDEHENHFKPPLGVAHFLEHKMFEQEDGIDPFTYFSKSGTDANASTSFDNTQYICMGTKNFQNNLRYLLSFVNSPYYTDENVEKEKGIIAEEINMYEDMPDFKIEMKLRECLYHNHPRRIDIAGTVDEIYKITKEDLYACYNNFYIPNNMFLIIVGNFDKEEAIDIIKEELENKPKKNLPSIGKISEPIKVKEKELKLEADIEVPKVAFGLKISTKNMKMKELELDLYLNMMTTLLFGTSSKFREEVREEKLLNNLYMEWESIESFQTFYFLSSSKYPEKLIQKIKDQFKKCNFQEKDFNRIKKVWISNEVRMTDNIESMMNNTYDDMLKYKKIIPNRLECIRKMNLEKLNKLVESINFQNTSVVTMSKDE